VLVCFHPDRSEAPLESVLAPPVAGLFFCGYALAFKQRLSSLAIKEKIAPKIARAGAFEMVADSNEGLSFVEAERLQVHEKAC
jgi:hypothetical protein